MIYFFLVFSSRRRHTRSLRDWSSDVCSSDLDDADRRDDLEANALYNLLEGEVVPRFYETNDEGVPPRWLEMVRHTLKSLGPKVLATRQVRDYVRELYAPAAHTARTLNSDYAGARTLSGWKHEVRAAWPGVRVEHVDSEGVGDQAVVGATLAVRAWVALGSLSPDDVEVQVVHGRIGSDDVLTATSATPMLVGESYDGNRGSASCCTRWPKASSPATGWRRSAPP